MNKEFPMTNFYKAVMADWEIVKVKKSLPSGNSLNLYRDLS